MTSAEKDYEAQPSPQPVAIDETGLPGLLRAVEELRNHSSPGLRAPLEQAASILERDLLSRQSGGDLVVSLVGPNNAGKSAVFNGVCGQTISPSRPTGGATRRILAASRTPEGVFLRGYSRSVVVPASRTGIEAALATGPEGELLMAGVPVLPPGMVLVDAPDFDSVLEGHRAGAEALLMVTDLAIVVVTRHSYQNLEVVEFLKAWLGMGRPYVLIYNEASSERTADLHMETLALGIGCPPRERFFALSDLQVAEGQAPLIPKVLGSAASLTLSAWLTEQVDPAALQRLSHEASVRSLASQLTAWHASWQTRDALRLQLANCAKAEALELASTITRAAMPMGPVLEAFRRVLDRRPGLLRTTYRKGLRKASDGLRFLVSKISGSLKSVKATPPDTLMQAEQEAFEPLWAPFIERLRATMMAAGAANDPDWHTSLLADLDATRLTEGQKWVETHLANDPVVWNAFAEYCEELVERELDKNGGEWALQAMLDLSHILPAAVAGVIVVKSGGLLTDVAIGSMGAVSSMAAERLSKFLGTQTAARARGRWTELRSEAWADWIVQAALPDTLPSLQAIDSKSIDPVRSWLQKDAPKS